MTVRNIGPDAYTDLSGLASLKRSASPDDAASVREAARQFESVFARMLLSSMRSASPGDPLFDSNEGGFYRDMFDDQLAMELSKGRGLGLADMLVQQLTRARAAEAAPAIDAAAGTREEFVQKFRPLAEVAGRRLGVAPETVLAHAALETGWGRHAPRDAQGASSFNFFGIKATGWSGAAVASGTTEYESGVARERIENFRAYDSPEAGISDYVRLIGDNPRYAAAVGTGADTARFARALQDGGYATDPRYAEKLQGVAASVREILDRGLKGGSGLPKQWLRSGA